MPTPSAGPCGSRILPSPGTASRAVWRLGPAGISLAVMPSLAHFKRKVAGQLDSRALLADAKETLACSYLSFTVLLGLAANATLGWWGAVPVAGPGGVPWLV